MANTISSLNQSFNTFTSKTLIKSSEMNTNFNNLKADIATLLNYMPTWHVYTLTASQFSAATTTTDIEVVTLTSKECVLATHIKTSSAFTGTAITVAELSVGYSATALDFLHPSFDVYQAVTESAYSIQNSFDIPSINTSTSLRARLTVVGANLSALTTTGTVELRVLKNTLP